MSRRRGGGPYRIPFTRQLNHGGGSLRGDSHLATLPPRHFTRTPRSVHYPRSGRGTLRTTHFHRGGHHMRILCAVFGLAVLAAGLCYPPDVTAQKKKRVAFTD